MTLGAEATFRTKRLLYSKPWRNKTATSNVYTISEFPSKLLSQAICREFISTPRSSPTLRVEGRPWQNRSPGGYKLVTDKGLQPPAGYGLCIDGVDRTHPHPHEQPGPHVATELLPGIEQAPS